MEEIKQRIAWLKDDKAKLEDWNGSNKGAYNLFNRINSHLDFIYQKLLEMETKNEPRTCEHPYNTTV